MRVAAALCVAIACVLVATGSGENATQSNRILFLAPISSKSHKNFYMGIVNALADRGSQVTIVSPFRPSKIRENVREILVPGINLHDYIPNLFKGKTAGPMALMSAAPTLCSEALGKEEVQALLKEEFDVVLISIFISHCFLSIVHKMQVPFIWVSPAGPVGASDQVIGNPMFPSFTGFTLLEAKHPLSFTERAISTFGETLSSFMMTHVITSWSKWKLCLPLSVQRKQLFTPSLPAQDFLFGRPSPSSHPEEWTPKEYGTRHLHQQDKESLDLRTSRLAVGKEHQRQTKTSQNRQISPQAKTPFIHHHPYAPTLISTGG